jgi:lipoprotein-releasing system permease protein
MGAVPLALLLALAHLRRRRTQNLISVLGVAIGVMVLTAALSLTNGFVKALIDATIKAVPHVTVVPWQPGPGGVAPSPKLEARLSGPEGRAQGVTGWGRISVTKGLLTRRASAGRSSGADFVTVFGVEPRREAAALGLAPGEREQLESLPADGALLGFDLAVQVGALRGDTVYLLTPTGADVSSLRRRAFRVSGTFRTGNYLIDSNLAFVRLEALQEVRQAPGLISGYHVRLADAERAPLASLELTRGTDFVGQPWQDQNRTLISQLALQKLVISIVLLLLVVVAAFGIVNVLVLTVFEKTPEIAILRAMGASSRTVVLVFLIEGLVLGGMGLVLGDLLGFGLSTYFRVRPVTLPGELYFITALPVEIRASDFLWVSVASLVTTVLAALVPARRAAAVQPARVIR